MRAALEAAGVDLPETHVKSATEVCYTNGVDGGAALLELAAPPTAVFAANDQLAAGLIEAARQRGLRVPYDLSVVGFDDTQLARIASPPLTTIRQPLQEMGAVGLQTALRLSRKEPIDTHHVELATKLVIRSSTSPPQEAH
jgi:LacI family transcriptional regulator